MNLHSVMVDDVTRVFCNGDEFAATHVINGQELSCIVDDAAQLAATEREDGFGNVSGIGVLAADRVVHCAAAALSPAPLPGARCVMDGEIWLVGDGVKVVEGMLTLPLNRAY